MFADLPRIGELLDETINEYYMFHGTKKDVLHIIGNQGFDQRLCRNGALFGSGVYFAESSTKADQYAGLSKYLYVAGSRIQKLSGYEYSGHILRTSPQGTHCNACCKSCAHYVRILAIHPSNGSSWCYRVNYSPTSPCLLRYHFREVFGFINFKFSTTRHLEDPLLYAMVCYHYILLMRLITLHYVDVRTVNRGSGQSRDQTEKDSRCK